MKLAVDAGELGEILPLVTAEGERRPKRIGWVSLAAVLRRMASWRRMEGFAGGEIKCGV